MVKKKNNYNMSVVDLSHYNIPHITEKDDKEWIEFGVDNLYPQYLIELFTGSGINGAIVKGVSSMIAGDQQDTCQGLDVVDKDELEGDLKEQYLKFSKLLKNGSRNTIKNLAFDLKLFGTCYVNVIWNKTKTAIAEIKHIPSQYIRSGKADSYGNVNEYYYCYDWSNIRKYKPHVIKAFNENGKIVQQKNIFHGYQSKVKVTKDSKIFKKRKIFKVGRYHSLKLYEPYNSKRIKISMRCSKTNIPMAIEDIEKKIFGFQFHPESFLTENGDFIIKKILSA